MSLSLEIDMESMEEIQELLRKAQFFFEKEIASKVQQGTAPEYREEEEENDVAVVPNGCGCSGLGCSCCHRIEISYFSQDCE